MPQFQYTAVNNSGKKLTGIIGAESEDEARKQLNTFGISVLEIQKSTVDPMPSKEAATDLKTFEFEAFDPTGKRVVGTIPASSRYKAFTRLMEEYKFEVAYVVPAGASEPEKEKAKQEDLSILKAEYEAEAKKRGEGPAAAQGPDLNFETQRQDLLKKVDMILEKIKQMVLTFDKDIKPENRQIIKGMIDKLLRIKSSTNLEYIEHTSEELLKKVQDQELFLHKEQMELKRQQLKLQTQQMMAELHTHPSTSKTVQESLADLQESWSTAQNPLLKAIGLWLLRFVPTEEEKELLSKIQTLNRQIWTFRRLWFFAEKSVKPEAYKSLQALHEERSRLQQSLKASRLARKQAEKQSQNTEVMEPLILDELTAFLGWLLSFYLAAYFVSQYVIAKQFPNGNPLPNNLNLLEINSLRSLLLSLFLWYAICKLRVEFFRSSPWTNSILFPAALILNATLIFNL